jgi:signal transduction histidine kinase
VKQPFSRRLLIGAALGIVVSGVLIILGLRAASPTIRTAAVMDQVSGIDHEACNAAPASWGWASGEVSFFAYDRSGRSANPGAPPLEDELLRRVLAHEEIVVERVQNRTIAVVPNAPDGPCALLRLTSRNLDVVIAPTFLSVLIGALVIGMLLAILGTLWLVVRPLRLRIEDVATAARHVGSASFAPQPGSPDALGHIAEVLAVSHDRILEARDALEERNRALEQHLAGIAHDLRTPLSSMHLALEALAAQSPGPARAEVRRALADAVYLSSMVENLHQATLLRGDVGVTSGSVELSDLVQRLEKRFAIVGRHAGVEVAANTPERAVWVACTPALAERAVANLVQNAVEHNTEPGHVAITLSLLDSGSRFELLVADDGPGLPRETLASLRHETFLVEDARTRGPGMGMLITTEVARRTGWSLSYEELEPTGLQVRIEGPVMEAPDAG